MSRPKPTVLLSHMVRFTGKEEQVLAAEAIYAVFHDGKPINLKSIVEKLDGAMTKYPKSSFSNSGHAFNLAQRLNDIFATDKFGVFRLTQGEEIIEVDEDGNE